MLYKDGTPEVACVKENFDVGKFILGAQERRSALPAFSCIQTTAAWLNFSG
jgi:hypothetical protein